MKILIIQNNYLINLKNSNKTLIIMKKLIISIISILIIKLILIMMNILMIIIISLEQ